MQKKQLLFLAILFFYSQKTLFSDLNNKDFSFWEKRAQKALLKKNIPAALFSLAHAEKKSSAFQRFSIVKQRVALESPADENPSAHTTLFFAVVLSFLNDIPLFLAQLILLIILFYSGYLVARKQNFKVKIKKRLLFLILFVFGISAVRIFLKNPIKAVSLSSTTPLHSGPNETFPQVFTIPRPSIISVEKVAGDYAKIQYKSQSGWCKKSLIAIIE
ncbi:hypothetical protein FJ366_01710 [Candidatus Dependentiae bacterium]|nr:hypothetical protein [Candidatus Dependentiae bacterium]